MDEGYNVFISWSGERSRMAAEALREWLPVVLQASKPWMSEEDIEKGSRGLEEVGRALDGMRIGIVCLTPENLSAQWVLYEVGALAKTLGEKTRVCTFLLGGLKSQDIRPPLGMFQSTRADDKKDAGRLIRDINKALSPPSVPDDSLETLFDAVWPILERKLQAIPTSPEIARAPRSVPEMVEEILELSRAAANSRKEVERLGRYIPLWEQLMGMLEDAAGGAGPASGFVLPSSPSRAVAAGLDAVAEKWHLGPLACASLQVMAARGALRPEEIERAAAALSAREKAADEQAKRLQQAEKKPNEEGQ